MTFGRRDCLKALALTGTGFALNGCSFVTRRITQPVLADKIALPPTEIHPIVRLLNRTSFGPVPGQVAIVASQGIENYITEQLHPSNIEPQLLSLRLAPLETLQLQSSELGDELLDEMIRQMQMACILRATYSPHQLRERMVDFWTNHFNIYARKGSSAYFKPHDDLEVIRKHALGSVHDLIRSSAHSPAMLQYLDNQVNRKRDDHGAGANENYARELMELHTLGVHGGYTQKDVQEVARCLTGWTVEGRFLHRKGTFRYDDTAHDKGAKTVLGVTIPAGGGENDGDKVLDILVKHPATAKFISHKICKYFLGDQADSWTDKMADIYLKTDGDITQMLRPMLLSKEIQSASPILKRPFDYAVSAMRALNADTDGGKGIQMHLTQMGQPLFQWPMPDGYPDRTSAWTGSILARWNFATALCTEGVSGTSINWKKLQERIPGGDKNETTKQLMELITAHRADDASSKMRNQRIVKHVSTATKGKPHMQIASLIVASPDFQWR